MTADPSVFEHHDDPGPASTGPGRDPRAAKPLRGRTKSDPAAWPDAARLASARILERFASAYAVVGAGGEVLHVSSHIGRFLRAAAGSTTRSVFEMARPGLRPALREVLRDAVETGRKAEQQGVNAKNWDGTARTMVTAERLPGPMGPAYLVVFSDMPESPGETPAAPPKAPQPAVPPAGEAAGNGPAEQHQRLLIDELNHRVKNMLTVVIAMASQSVQATETVETFSAAFLGRLQALAAAYALLAREDWSGISLLDVVAEELGPFTDVGRQNIRIAGPDVPLDPRRALALGMAIHELATNAVKYGALSTAAGRVSVSWRLEPAPDGQLLVFDWAESGGPAVVVPAVKGFGIDLIERGLSYELGGEARIVFAPDGVCATLRAPLPQDDQRDDDQGGDVMGDAGQDPRQEIAELSGIEKLTS